MSSIDNVLRNLFAEDINSRNMSQTSSKTIALSIARRQKRLLYWQKQLSGAGLDAEKVKDIKEHINTFALLLSKMANAISEGQAQETETRLQALERELTGLFESRRLTTSSIGAPAITD